MQIQLGHDLVLTLDGVRLLLSDIFETLIALVRSQELLFEQCDVCLQSQADATFSPDFHFHDSETLEVNRLIIISAREYILLLDQLVRHHHSLTGCGDGCDSVLSLYCTGIGLFP